MLRIAATSGVLSLVLATAGLTLALVSMASPPVFEHGSPAAQEFQTGRMRTLWVFPAFALMISGWALMQVVTRQPTFTRLSSTPRRSMLSPPTLATHGLLVLICLLCSGASLFAGLQSIAYSPYPNVTDNPAFSGLNLALAMPAVMLAFFSMRALRLWSDWAPGVIDGAESEQNLVRTSPESQRSSL